MNGFESVFHFDSLVWDWIIAIYLFLAGMSAGAVMISIYLKRKVIEGDPAKKRHHESDGLARTIWHHCWVGNFDFPFNQAFRVLEDHDLLQPNVCDVDGRDLVPSVHDRVVCLDWRYLPPSNHQLL